MPSLEKSSSTQIDKASPSASVISVLPTGIDRIEPTNEVLAILSFRQRLRRW